MRKSILVSLTISALAPAAGGGQTPAPPSAPARRAVERRLAALLDAPPFNRASWAIYAVDERGRVLVDRNGGRFAVPASNTKLVVSAAAAILLPADYRARTSLFVNGTVTDGVLQGDLVLYGRGDPSFSSRCFGVDTLAPGVCDSSSTPIRALADSVRARGIRRVTGRVVGDGSYFEPVTLHPNWSVFDLNWWYAAPVTGLAFNDNAIDFRITPGEAVDRPPTITWSPDLGLIGFENRARTGPADSGSTIGDNFFRKPGTWDIWAEGTVALGRRPWVESFAVPDPNLFAARALARELQERGIAIEGGSASTTDSLAYRAARCCAAPLAEWAGRPLPDLVFPILNTSQNLFAEALLKILGRERGTGGSWSGGLEVERRFLVDSVRLDSTSFALDDGSGLSAGNLIAPSAFVQLLRYMAAHPRATPFLAALPRSGAPGSLRTRFLLTPLEGRVVAKTGSIHRVNTLSGYIEHRDGRRTTFSIQANSHAVPTRQMLAQIDSVVVAIGTAK
jgi:D-alanyl-D-alanine carboxypeptidase/D-alanyl-D-alanine-endopeptidase (penicillin-binding protein 4)